MKKILVGYIGLGKTSGIDKYLFSFLERMKENGVQVDFLSRFEDKELKEKLEKEGCNLFKISRNRHFIRQFKEMKKIIKDNNYDIGYFNISTSYNCIGIISSKIFGIKKTVVHSHSSGLEIYNPIKKGILTFINFLFKPIISICSDLNLACSDKAAKWLFSKNVYDNDDYYIIYNAVNYEKFKFNEDKRKKIRKEFNVDDKFVVGHVGRFSYPKNHKFLLKTFKEYNKINPKSVLICVGEGDDFENTIEYSKKIGIYDSVIFTGPIDNVEEVIQAFDCFLLPSKYEGLPVVGIEAQFSQTKCIFSDRITKMSIISDDNIMLPIRNPKLWAKNISSKKTKLNDHADNFKLEKNNKQFDKIIDAYSGKYNFASLIFKILLVIHYFLNLTVFYNGFNYLMVPCGILLLFIFFSKKYNYIKTILRENKVFLLYLLFMISYIITFIFTKRYELVDSLKTFIWTALHLFFVFNSTYLNNKLSFKKEIYKVFKFIVCVLSIININNLFLLLRHVNSRTVSFDGKIHLYGTTNWGRFYGNFYDANYASVACVCTILMAIYLFKICKSKIEKVLLILTIILQMIYIYFGESRTGLVCFAIAFVLYIFMSSIMNKFKIKRFLLLCILFFMTVFVLPKQSIMAYDYFTNKLNKPKIVITNNANDNNTSNTIIGDDTIVVEPKIEIIEDKIKVGRTDYQDDYSNGRLSIWKCGYETFKKNMLIGIGYSNIYDYSAENMPTSYVATHKFAAFHNFIIDIAVSQGIIGLIISFLIFLYYLVNSIKLYKIIKIYNGDYFIYTILLTILVSVIGASLFVSQIFYINNYVTFVFWLILGYFYTLIINNRRNYEK